MNERSLRKMAEVEELLDKLTGDWDERGELHLDPANVEAIHAYASALVRWEDDGYNANSFFSTDNLVLLRHRSELRGRFVLPVMDKAEGEARERDLGRTMAVHRKDVSKDFLN
jgi:hypothetical protein